jgi:hypothetical protein
MIQVAAYKTAKNTTTLKFKATGDLTGITVDQDGYFDFAANNVTKVEVIVDGITLDTTMAAEQSVIIDGVNLLVEFGDLDIPTGNYPNVQVWVYINGSSEGIILAGPGLKSWIMLSYFNNGA